MTTTTNIDTDRVEALSGRLFMAGLEALELLNVELGLRLGLYAALADNGQLTTSELAATTSISERYAREWLEQQAVTGMLEVDDVAAAPTPGATSCLRRTPTSCSTPTAQPTRPPWPRSSPRLVACCRRW